MNLKEQKESKEACLLLLAVAQSAVELELKISKDAKKIKQ